MRSSDTTEPDSPLWSFVPPPTDSEIAPDRRKNHGQRVWPQQRNTDRHTAQSVTDHPKLFNPHHRLLLQLAPFLVTG
jgi:hypothetical protein